MLRDGSVRHQREKTGVRAISKASARMRGSSNHRTVKPRQGVCLGLAGLARRVLAPKVKGGAYACWEKMLRGNTSGTGR